MRLIKLLIPVSLIILLLCANNPSHSQPYQSLFGNNNTKWVFEWGNLPGFSQDTIYVANDTLVDGLWWRNLKASRNNIFGYFAGAVIREDTTLGKVWYKGFHPQDSATKLAFDFSLQKGDTFDIHSVWGDPPVSDKIVDTVYYQDGRKIIVFKSINFKFGERTTFIEGIGSNYGIIYKQYLSLVLAHYLLCSYKDGQKIFSNKYYNGECNIHFPSSIQDISPDLMEIFPNPVKGKLYLKTNTPNLFTGIRIVNSLGNIIIQQPFENEIDVSRFLPGFYLIQITTKTGKTYSKKLIFQ